MRSITITMTCLLLAAAPACSAETMAPDWSLQTADGQTLRLSEEVRKQPTVLFFWATWCPYCKALMPHLQSIRLEYGDDVKILAINFREDGADPVAFIQDTGYDFTVLPNGEEVAKLYEVWGTPGLIVIDGAQRIHFDLRNVPDKPPPASAKSKTHRARAAYRAPYWAAELRQSLDALTRVASE